MKIIEALKKVKSLQVKAADLREKIARYHADMDHESAVYPDQKTQVSEWFQAHADVLKEIERLRLCISRTNLVTTVTITLDEKNVVKPITSWISRRKELATLELAAWDLLTDKGLRDGVIKTSGGELKDTKVRRYYDPKERDKRRGALREEPSLIDAALEIVNATTELVEA